MDEYAFVGENIEKLQKMIHAAAMRSGRRPEEVAILAVSKFHSIEAVEEAYAFGIHRFGENRVQEAIGKFLPESHVAMPELTVDMIGTLQGNKVGKALNIFDCIQSISSLELLDAIAKRLGDREKILKIYLELHTGEESKSGFPTIESLFDAVEAYIRLKEGDGSPAKSSHPFELVGLMTMAAFTEDRQSIRSSFRQLAKAADEIRKRFNLPAFNQLSMGMSNDFEIAIEEGATLLRIGTAIFGVRT